MIGISCRALMSQIQHYVPDEGGRRELADALVAYVYALKHQLRGTDPGADLVRFLGRERAQAVLARSCRPVAILYQIRAALAASHRPRQVSDAELWLLDGQISERGRVGGGCERIASTPIPFAYGVLLHRTIYTCCIMLPFGLVDSADVFTPLLCVFISYTLVALEAIANEVGAPFSRAPNALALDAMTRNIERAVFRPVRPRPARRNQARARVPADLSRAAARRAPANCAGAACLSFLPCFSVLLPHGCPGLRGRMPPGGYCNSRSRQA